MVQMKVTASVLLIAAAIAPVVADGFETEDSLVIRDDNELTSYFERDFDLELEEREFHDDLFEREPFGAKFMKKAFRMGRKHGGSVAPPETPNETREFNDDVFEREFEEELYERSSSSSGGPRGHGGSGGHGGSSSGAGGHGGGGHGSSGHGSSSASHGRPKRRDVEKELYERSSSSSGGPRGHGGSGGHGGSSSGAGGHGGSGHGSSGHGSSSASHGRPKRRDVEELYERSSSSSGGPRGHGGSGGHGGSSSGAGGHGGSGHGSSGHGSSSASHGRPKRRDVEEELYERSSSSSGGPRGHGGSGGHGGSSSGTGGHGGSGHGSSGHGSSSASHGGRPKRREFTEELEERETRSFDEMETLEREYYDELD